MSWADHPRMRGEDPNVRHRAERGGGSPPHARGRRVPGASTQMAKVDHPRMRGEDVGLWPETGVKMGSPPHARGRPADTSPVAFFVRITPACAGKTARRQRSAQVPPDHPRMRGEDGF